MFLVKTRPQPGRLQKWFMKGGAVLALGLAGCGGGGASESPTATEAGLQAERAAATATKSTGTSSPVALASSPLAMTSARLAVAMDDMEALTPFASWANLKRDYGAVGDGIADDGPAIQRALNDLGWSGKPSVLYLPPGKYKITKTLNLVGSPQVGGFWHGGVSLVGETAEQTQIVWAGPAGDPMLIQNGGFNTRYSRITWDGKNVAGYGVAHWWNAKSGIQFDGSPEHTDEVFKDMKVGIMAGRMGADYGQMNSEGQVRRVRFINNTTAGVNAGSWNALNWWVWDSTFTDCGRGVSNVFTVSDINEPGAGAVHVYRSVFQRSKVADVHIANTGFFSMHQNVSSGSRRFFQAENIGSNNASVVIKGNRILDTTDPAAIVNGNLGPLMLIDNQIRSAAGVTAPAVILNDSYKGRDVASIGNQYTVSSPIKVVDGSDRVYSLDDTVVSRSAIDGTVPLMQSAPMRTNRKVYEVPAGAGDTVIQAIIYTAAQSGLPNPIVHFPPGTYKISKTLVIPALSQIQLVGDALTTTLQWTGPNYGILFQLDGPSYATIRDMHILANQPSARAFVLNNANQANGRVLVMGSSLGPLSSRNLTSTQISLQANTGISSMALSNTRGLVSMGVGGIGPVSVTEGSQALVADTWYEGYDTQLYRVQSGEFTYLNGHVAPATHSGPSDLSLASLTMDALAGKATFVGISLNLGAIPSGVGVRVTNETASTQVLTLGASSDNGKYFERTGSAGSVGFLLSKGVDANRRSTTLVDQGRSDATFVRSMLGQARALVWETAPYQATTGSTDVRIYRVHSPQTLGVLISGQ